jgi:hypothetical protein
MEVAEALKQRLHEPGDRVGCSVAVGFHEGPGGTELPGGRMLPREAGPQASPVSLQVSSRDRSENMLRDHVDR